eukprot:TRINITY_DN3624_c0_g1_i1.p1 TRINITY_DN3624_c0_g1~~TRINITY_DN3624_c0_g1_i1.p1  ORF type:complete len:475 (-),score=97.24 TRINITY_DN3624_c0_g1_i1:76-1500(-)
MESIPRTQPGNRTSIVIPPRARFPYQPAPPPKHQIRQVIKEDENLEDDRGLRGLKPNLHSREVMLRLTKNRERQQLNTNSANTPKIIAPALAKFNNNNHHHHDKISLRRNAQPPPRPVESLLFRCNFCKKVFARKAELDRHGLSCSYSPQRFGEKSAAKRNEPQRERTEPQRERTEPQRERTEPLMDRFERLKHQCDFCKRVSANEDMLKLHQMMCEVRLNSRRKTAENRLVFCKECGKHFLLADLFKNHPCKDPERRDIRQFKNLNLSDCLRAPSLSELEYDDLQRAPQSSGKNIVNLLQYSTAPPHESNPNTRTQRGTSAANSSTPRRRRTRTEAAEPERRNMFAYRDDDDPDNYNPDAAFEDDEIGDNDDLEDDEEEEEAEVRRKKEGLTLKEMRMIGSLQLSDRLIREMELSECSICFNAFKPRDFMRTLCGGKQHFHVKCIDMWFKNHVTCPMCRESVMGKNNQCIKIH